MKTKNIYDCPVYSFEIMRICHKESPAHVGRLKNAVDFIVPKGTPVKAAQDGIVIDLKIDSDVGGSDKKFDKLGNFIEIKHLNAECSEYEHILKDGALVKIGDSVKKGQLIGFSGDTGWIANLGPHLHFMVGKYGKYNENYETMEICWNKE